LHPAGPSPLNDEGDLRWYGCVHLRRRWGKTVVEHRANAMQKATGLFTGDAARGRLVPWRRAMFRSFNEHVGYGRGALPANRTVALRCGSMPE
jgi:hypothetical protein